MKQARGRLGIGCTHSKPAGWERAVRVPERRCIWIVQQKPAAAQYMEPEPVRDRHRNLRGSATGEESARSARTHLWGGVTLLQCSGERARRRD